MQDINLPGDCSQRIYNVLFLCTGNSAQSLSSTLLKKTPLERISARVGRDFLLEDHFIRSWAAMLLIALGRL